MVTDSELFVGKDPISYKRNRVESLESTNPGRMKRSEWSIVKSGT